MQNGKRSGEVSLKEGPNKFLGQARQAPVIAMPRLAKANQFIRTFLPETWQLFRKPFFANNFMWFLKVTWYKGSCWCHRWGVSLQYFNFRRCSLIERNQCNQSRMMWIKLSFSWQYKNLIWDDQSREREPQKLVCKQTQMFCNLPTHRVEEFSGPGLPRVPWHCLHCSLFTANLLDQSHFNQHFLGRDIFMAANVYVNINLFGDNLLVQSQVN